MAQIPIISGPIKQTDRREFLRTRLPFSQARTDIQRGKDTDVKEQPDMNWDFRFGHPAAVRVLQSKAPMQGLRSACVVAQ